jgi:hypothetical protein
MENQQAFQSVGHIAGVAMKKQDHPTGSFCREEPGGYLYTIPGLIGYILIRQVEFRRKLAYPPGGEIDELSLKNIEVKADKQVHDD